MTEGDDYIEGTCLLTSIYQPQTYVSFQLAIRISYPFLTFFSSSTSIAGNTAFIFVPS